MRLVKWINHKHIFSPHKTRTVSEHYFNPGNRLSIYVRNEIGYSRALKKDSMTFSHAIPKSFRSVHNSLCYRLTLLPEPEPPSFLW